MGSDAVAWNDTAAHGMVAGAVARVAVAPLDLVKVRLQLQGVSPSSRAAQYRGVFHALRTVAAEEGPRALWKGNAAAMTMVAVYGGVQFAVYHSLPARGEGAVPAWARGAAAGAAATAASYPLDLMRTRLASQQERAVYRGIAHGVRAAMARDGLRGLYAGVGATMAGVVPYAGAQFAAYEALSRAWGGEGGTARSAVCGAAAGAFSKAATMPVDVVKRRMQVLTFQWERTSPRGLATVPRAAGAIATARLILRGEGPAGLFRGLSPALLKSAPYSAITFAVFDMLQRHAPRMGWRKRHK